MTPEEYGQRIKALEEEVALLKEHISRDQEDLEKVSEEKDALVLQIEELVAVAKRHREERDHYKERWLDNLAKLTHTERLISEMKAEAERKDKLWEDATVKNLEAVTELIEALGPFYLHGMALRGTILPDNAPINRVGSSYLVKGAFETAIEAFQKWQDLLDGKEQQTEKRKDETPHAVRCQCPECKKMDV